LDEKPLLLPISITSDHSVHDSELQACEEHQPKFGRTTPTQRRGSAGLTYKEGVYPSPVGEYMDFDIGVTIYNYTQIEGLLACGTWCA